ncbi:MAG: relaxase/mobilization nuclease domain-containing protein [Advenella sp.]|uniref:relaxase/mobilization nuclease domain-containing protein n=1 Tax=Advenella sp. TaxID=1872388 RepID=UPI00258796F9|nr:relaxase/mobilization nuclease domain-containing protein [Advenella sp.]MDD3759163.1 relaxase/mobilization nuclease domain-containing protein [Advenella sp.]
MGLNYRVDNWFLGYERSIKPRKGGGGGHGFKSGTGLKNLKAAGLKKPEVMVKIPKRTGNSSGMKGVKNHLDYISRNASLELENQDGHKISGTKDIKETLGDWRNFGIPENSEKREALNLVLSMPPGTDPQAVKDAAREFAKEQFKGHQYVFVLHTDEPHPHVHLAVSMRDELGKRMNPRKNDLFHWRVHFAEKMREQGVDCAATKRQHRGKVQKGEHSILRNMQKRGAVSEIQKSQVEELIIAIKENKRPLHPFLKEHLETKRMIGEEYRFLAKELYQAGLKTEARAISLLNREVMQADNKTRAQERFDDVIGVVKEQELNR